MLRREYGRLLLNHTTFKIGGPVFCWVEPENCDDILEAIEFAEADSKPLAIIGKGSNVLARDEGFEGVLITLSAGFDYIDKEEDGIVKVGSGVLISRLIRECSESGLTGCEFLAGIPGSFGGAVFMNAGARDIKNPGINKEIKDIIVDVDVLDLKDKKRKIFKKKDIDFNYRFSGLDGKCILGARIKLEKDEKDAIINRIASYRKKRQWIQDMGFPSAGSVFKNPDNTRPAGSLIEQCGLKGKRIGGAEISEMHANFIVNTGNAMSKDVLDLIELAKKSVREKFGVELELELRVI